MSTPTATLTLSTRTAPTPTITTAFVTFKPVICLIDLDRFCIPDYQNYTNVIMDYFSGGNLGKYMGDLGTCWWLFLVMLGISTFIAVIYLWLLRCIAAPLIYVSFVLILAILVAGGAYVFG